MAKIISFESVLAEVMDYLTSPAININDETNIESSNQIFEINSKDTLIKSKKSELKNDI